MISAAGHLAIPPMRLGIAAPKRVLSEESIGSVFEGRMSPHNFHNLQRDIGTGNM
jgi:hypothetical protein